MAAKNNVNKDIGFAMEPIAIASVISLRVKLFVDESTVW